MSDQIHTIALERIFLALPFLDFFVPSFRHLCIFLLRFPCRLSDPCHCSFLLLHTDLSFLQHSLYHGPYLLFSSSLFVLPQFDTIPAIESATQFSRRLISSSPSQKPSFAQPFTSTALVPRGKRVGAAADS